MPGDEPGTVAIATVIHRRDYAIFERRRCQGTPQSDSQRFFGDPSATELAYSLRIGLVALVKEEKYALNEAPYFLHTGHLSILGQALSDCVFQAVLPIDNALENIGKQPGRQVARRVSVSQAP